MNLKKSLLPSASVLAVIAALLDYLNPSPASSAPDEILLNKAVIQTPAETSQAPSPSLSNRLLIPISKATYQLEEPAIQFDYNPNLFVLSSFDLTLSSSEEESEDRSLTSFSCASLSACDFEKAGFCTSCR